MYLSLFFMNSLTDQTRRWFFTLDSSNDARKGVLFGGFVDIAPYFPIGGKSPSQKQFLGGVNRRFQAKREKY